MAIIGENHSVQHQLMVIEARKDEPTFSAREFVTVSKVLSCNCWRIWLLLKSHNLNVTDLLLKNPDTKDIFVVVMFQQKIVLLGNLMI